MDSEKKNVSAISESQPNASNKVEKDITTDINPTKLQEHSNISENTDETSTDSFVTASDSSPEKVPEAVKSIKSNKGFDEEPKVDTKNKRSDKARKKNEKNHELFLKSLQGLPYQDQCDILTKKTNEMMEEMRTLSSTNKLYKSKVAVLEKEKQQLQSEQNKNLIARSRLENICRELQRQNKQIKDETAAKIRDEEEKRKEVTTKFQTTLSDVSKMMEQNSNENIKLRDDNIQISDRFKKLCEEFKAREEDIQRVSKQLSLEKKLSEASLARCQLELEAEKCEKEVFLKEKEELLKKIHDITKEKLLLEMNMKNMEEHLAKYTDKYQMFETTITRSNEIFENYKLELAAMSNQVSKLESDCTTWKDRWVQTSHSVNRLIHVNQTLEEDIKLSDKKLEQLMSLSRFLQSERTRYLKQLKENKIEPKPASSENSSESSNSDSTQKLLSTFAHPPPKHRDTSSSKPSPYTIKERQLQSLRQEIVKLQSEINKAVEKEIEEELKAKQQLEDDSKNKRRPKNKKGKKPGKTEEKIHRIVSDVVSSKSPVFEKPESPLPNTLPLSNILPSEKLKNNPANSNSSSSATCSLNKTESTEKDIVIGTEDVQTEISVNSVPVTSPISLSECNNKEETINLEEKNDVVKENENEVTDTLDALLTEGNSDAVKVPIEKKEEPLETVYVSEKREVVGEKQDCDSNVGKSVLPSENIVESQSNFASTRVPRDDGRKVGENILDSHCKIASMTLPQDNDEKVEENKVVKEKETEVTGTTILDTLLAEENNVEVPTEKKEELPESVSINEEPEEVHEKQDRVSNAGKSVLPSENILEPHCNFASFTIPPNGAVTNDTNNLN